VFVGARILPPLCPPARRCFGARRHPPCDLVGVLSSSICADGGWGRTVAFSGHFVRARGALVGGRGSARSGAASACAWFRFALRTPPGRPRPISLEATQEGPISNSKKAQHIHFGFQVHIQTPIQLMPEGTPVGHHLDPRVRDGRWEGMEEAISLHSWDSRLAFFLDFAPLPKPRHLASDLKTGPMRLSSRCFGRRSPRGRFALRCTLQSNISDVAQPRRTPRGQPQVR
jgi:hypothetical protein